jgi:hypothetical protein|tara:strand:- start:16736 stop:16882 length:147 start_codon:yes stop_codon:yes gene_type:complete
MAYFVRVSKPAIKRSKEYTGRIGRMAKPIGALTNKRPKERFAFYPLHP